MLTTALTFRVFKSAYVWPVPIKTIGCPVMYVIDMAAPTCKQKKYPIVKIKCLNETKV